MSSNNLLTLLAGILCLCLTGCGSISDSEPLGSGYIWVTHTQNSISEPSASQFELQYSPGKGKWWVMVWPDLYPSKVVIKDQIAVFVGTKAYEPPDPNERRATNPRLFAVKAPGLPLDITDEVLWRCAKQSDNPQLFASPIAGDMAELLKDPDLMKKAYIGHIEETNSVLEFYFQIRDAGPSGTIHLSCNQIPDIMREVKENGVVRKDRVWHKTYLEKEFKTGIQK